MDARMPEIRSPFLNAPVHAPQRPAPPPRAPVDAFEAAPAPASHPLRKIALGGLAALTVAGVVSGTAVQVVASAPICQTQSVAVQDGHVCVSPELGAKGANLSRYMRSVPYQGDLAHDLTSSANRVYHPHGEQAPPRPAMEDGQLRVVSWNIHKSQSPDAQGARPEDRAVIDTLRRADGDVYILQEVGPWQVQGLVDATGMDGYYSMTIPDQGDLILVNPALDVTADAHAVVNRDAAPTARQGFEGWLHGDEVRQAQAVRIEAPGGEGVVVWNSHLMTTADTSTPEGRQARVDEAERIESFLDAFARPGDAITGGGDFNAGAASPTVATLQRGGYQTSSGGASIDWIATRGAEARGVESQRWTLADGVTQISDHPMVTADITLPG